MKEKYLWQYQDLPAIVCGRVPQVLLVGNGINLPFGANSWQELICNALSRNRSMYAYDDIKDMPATMQIVVATANNLGNCIEEKNNVKKEVQIIAEKIRVGSLGKDQKKLLESILGLPVDTILNTNYSNEFELCATNNASLYGLRTCQRRTKTVSGVEEQFRLFQFSSLGEKYSGKTLWHIHGDITKPSSMVIGHYYYGKLQKQIEDRAAICKRNHSIALKKGFSYKPKSWVDFFLLGDVYILGLGMYMAEQDLWWLLSFKKRHFPETKVYYYQPEKKIDKNVKKLLYAYGVEPITDTPFLADNYINYYHLAIESIKTKITKK